MKKIKYPIYTAVLSLFTFVGCQSDDTSVASEIGEVELKFSSAVAEMNSEQIGSRANATNNFFKEGDSITINIISDKVETKERHKYVYNSNNVFEGGEDAYRFKLDNTYIKSLEALWPSQSVRDEGIVLDQRKYDDYKKADRIIATANQVNIMPTGEPVPLIFKHEQSRFTFRMAGQNANGLNIESLILELQYDDPYDESTANVGGAFWAYCNNTSTAELVLLPGIEINTQEEKFQVVGNRFMIGMATVGNEQTKYTGGIWLKTDVNVMLEAGKDYLITLTPEGYDLTATISINSFGQGEGYVGIPLQKPVTSTIEGVDYEINTALQLMTLSRYISNSVKGIDAHDWNSKTYQINNVTMTNSAKKYYVPFTTANFTGKLVDTDGNNVVSVPLEGTATFNLFE